MKSWVKNGEFMHASVRLSRVLQEKAVRGMSLAELQDEKLKLGNVLKNVTAEYEDRVETMQCLSARIDVVDAHINLLNESNHDKPLMEVGNA